MLVLALCVVDNCAGISSVLVLVGICLQCIDTVGWAQEGHPACKKHGRWWRLALLSPDGVAPSRMVGVSASVNLPLHHKVQKFFLGTGSPGWSRKQGRKTVVVWCVGISWQRWSVWPHLWKANRSHHFGFHSCFSGGPGLTGSPYFFFSTCFRREPLGICDTGVWWIRCPSCHSARSVGPLKATQLWPQPGKMTHWPHSAPGC